MSNFRFDRIWPSFWSFSMLLSGRGLWYRHDLATSELFVFSSLSSVILLRFLSSIFTAEFRPWILTWLSRHFVVTSTWSSFLSLSWGAICSWLTRFQVGFRTIIVSIKGFLQPISESRLFCFAYISCKTKTCGPFWELPHGCLSLSWDSRRVQACLFTLLFATCIS